MWVIDDFFPRLASAVLTLILVYSTPSYAVQEVAQRPNVLLVLADDVGTGEVPGYWNTGLVEMPNLQKLVDEGITFTDAHSTPLCSPSRYVILSGNYQHRGHLYGSTWKVNYQSGQFHDDQMSIADVFKANGYHTAMMGKWHLGGKAPTKDWYDPGDEYYILDYRQMLSRERFDWSKPLESGPQDIGFDSSFVTTGGIQESPYTFLRDGFFEDLSNVTYWEEGKYRRPGGRSIINEEGEGSIDWDSTVYNMLLVNETARFLDDHEANRNGDPFFAFVALGNVHIPHSPPNKYLDGSRVARQYETRHMDVLLEMDKVMGSLNQLLEERNMENDTIVVFTSDNGGLGDKYSGKYGHNSHGPLRGAKGSIWEGGHRIPLIMKWKNGFSSEGESRSHLIGLNDIYATLSELVGIEVPAGQGIDSVSYADYILNGNNTESLREYLGTWLLKQGVIYEEAIRKQNLKLIRNPHNRTVLLYDLETDISETIDLNANDVSNQYENEINDMIEKLEAISPCYDDEGKFNVAIDGQIERKSCDWFGAMKRRCKHYPEGRIHCRYACAGKNRSTCNDLDIPNLPSSSPSANSPPSIFTTSPQPVPTTCIDTTGNFQVGIRERTCNWVQSDNTNQRCRNAIISQKCPMTCDSCGQCFDTPGFFSISSDSKKRCRWASQKPGKRCSNEIVNAHCPVTCNSCP